MFLNTISFKYSISKGCRMVFGVVALVLLFLVACKSNKTPSVELVSTLDTNENKINYHFSLPDSISFADELVPLKRFDVKEALDREFTVNVHWHSHTNLLLKKAHRFLPIIEDILKANNIPDDFKYLAIIESDLENLVSPRGAAGFWQFMPATAKEFGLELSNTVDERYHLEKATKAACNYLKNAYLHYNKNWTLAAASYNVGMGSLDESLKSQGVTSYYDLHLNKETARYVYRIIALKLIFLNAADYGYSINQKDLYSPISCQTLSIDSSIKDLPRFAKEIKTNYKLLKILNPWLIKDYLENPNHKKYEFKIVSNN